MWVVRLPLEAQTLEIPQIRERQVRYYRPEAMVQVPLAWGNILVSHGTNNTSGEAVAWIFKCTEKKAEP